MEWYINESINDGYPYNSECDAAGKVELIAPVPKWTWQINPLINDGYPYLKPIQDITKGAFYGCCNLETAVIPETVRFIGNNAFLGTSVSEITVSEKCIISDTALPDSCIVKYY